MPRIIAELSTPVGFQLVAANDPAFPVELTVRLPDDETMHHLPFRYTEPDLALRDSVAFQERLATSLADLRDALEQDTSPPSRFSHPWIWMFGVATFALLATLLVPELRSEYGDLLPVWIGAMVLGLGMQWVHGREKGVEVIAVGHPDAVVEGVRAVLVLQGRPLDGDVLTPAVRLEDSA